MTLDDFDIEHIDTIEFVVSVEEGEDIQSYYVPASDDVLQAVEDMLLDTFLQFNRISEEDFRVFEVSEKYGSKEKLKAVNDNDWMTAVNDIFSEEGMPSSSQILTNPRSLIYYRAIFTDTSGRKLVAVRRATYFKGVIKKKLIHLIDDELQLLDDNVFKLDTDFDFLICDDETYILRPTSFEYIADVGALVAEKAAEKAEKLGEQIDFIDFSGVAEFVKDRKRASRLVAAISVRNDLENIRQEKFAAFAVNSGVIFEENENGLLVPAEGSELKLLEVLDRRRYPVDFNDDDEVEVYTAAARSKAN